MQLQGVDDSLHFHLMGTDLNFSPSYPLEHQKLQTPSNSEIKLAPPPLTHKNIINARSDFKKSAYKKSIINYTSNSSVLPHSVNSPVVSRTKCLVVIHNLCFVSSDGVYEIQWVSTMKFPL